MNKAIFMGRLGGDPEIRATQSGKLVATFNLAVGRKKRQGGENETDWFTVVAWGKLAEIAEKYLRKGAKVLVTAAARTRSYEDKTGRKVWVTEFVAESIEFCDSKSKDEGVSTDIDAMASQIVDSFPEYEGTEDMPF